MFSFPHSKRVPAHRFGRRPLFTYATPAEPNPALLLSDDARLFLTTFAGGLLFMTVYLA